MINKKKSRPTGDKRLVKKSYWLEVGQATKVVEQAKKIGTRESVIIRELINKAQF